MQVDRYFTGIAGQATVPVWHQLPIVVAVVARGFFARGAFCQKGRCVDRVNQAVCWVAQLLRFHVFHDFIGFS